MIAYTIYTKNIIDHSTWWINNYIRNIKSKSTRNIDKIKGVIMHIHSVYIYGFELREQ